MPIRKKGNKWHWGSKGPFDSRKKAAEVARAAHASGYEGSMVEKSLLKLIKGIPLQKLQLPDQLPRASGTVQRRLAGAKKYHKALENGELLSFHEHYNGHEDMFAVHNHMNGIEDDHFDSIPYGFVSRNNSALGFVRSFPGRRFKGLDMPSWESSRHRGQEITRLWPGGKNERMTPGEFQRRHVLGELHTFTPGHYRNEHPDTDSFENDDVLNPGMNNASRGMMDDTLRRIRQLHPSFGESDKDIQQLATQVPKSIQHPTSAETSAGVPEQFQKPTHEEQVHLRPEEQESLRQEGGRGERGEQGGQYYDFNRGLRSEESLPTYGRRQVNPEARTEARMPLPSEGVPEGHDHWGQFWPPDSGASMSSGRWTGPSSGASMSSSAFPAQPKSDAFKRNFPDLYKEAMLKLLKEGDSSAADGLSSTIFTSTHAGIFNPTYGGSKVRRMHRKNRRKQDKKRRRLMGKDKKNGVDRLVQFLGHGSPIFHKRQPDKMMTGQFQGVSASAENKTPRKQIDWRQEEDEYDIEKTVEKINWDKRQEGISKVESHPTVGINNAGDGKMQEAGVAQVETTADNLATMTRSDVKKVDWNHRNYGILNQDIEKAGTHMSNITPLTNQNSESADGPHPQRAFTEKTPSKELRQQVIQQNDFENRVKRYMDKENDPGIEQPQAAGAAAGMASYPNSNMQMMEKSGWGSGIDINQDDLHRGGDKDISDDEEDIDAGKRGNDVWIPENEDTVKAEKDALRKFQKLYIETLLKEDTSPMLSALMALDND